MLKLSTPERIARYAFGGSDILKLQSQHETFLKEIKHLPDTEKGVEISNAIKFLIQNKGYYWLETAYLLNTLFGDPDTDGKTDTDSETKPLYQLAEPGITKKEYCPKYLGISYSTASDYIRAIRDYKNFGFTEEQIRVLGFSRTVDILNKSKDKTGMPVLSELRNKSLEELKKLTRAEIRKTKRKSNVEILNQYWNKATAKEKQEFLRKINAGENSGMD